MAARQGDELTLDQAQMMPNDHLGACAVVAVGLESQAEQEHVLRLEGELVAEGTEELAAGWDPADFAAEGGYLIGRGRLDLAQLEAARIEPAGDGCGLVAWLSDDAFLMIRWTPVDGVDVERGDA